MWWRREKQKKYILGTSINNCTLRLYQASYKWHNRRWAEENVLDIGPSLGQFLLFRRCVRPLSSELAVYSTLVKAKYSSNIPQWKDVWIVIVLSSLAETIHSALLDSSTVQYMRLFNKFCTRYKHTVFPEHTTINQQNAHNLSFTHSWLY